MTTSSDRQASRLYPKREEEGYCYYLSVKAAITKGWRERVVAYIM